MAVSDYVTTTVDSARRQANRLVSPSDRQKAYDTVNAFAHARPILFSFIVAQLLFSLIPALLFASFVLGTLAFAFFAAVAFALFWIGVAGLVLGSALLVTSSLATLAWLWLVGAYVAGNFAYGLVAGRGDAEGQDLRARMEEKWANIRKVEATETNGVKQEGGPPNYIDEKASAT